MTTFEKIVAVLNLIAVLLIPVVAVIVGQYLQERVQKRKDKMQIFQCLMTRRITGWAALEAVNAINSIDMMANDLGYKDKITWDIIQNPYYPEGLNQQLTMNTQIMNGQVEWAKAAGLLSQIMSKPQQNSEDTDHANT